MAAVQDIFSVRALAQIERQDLIESLEGEMFDSVGHHQLPDVADVEPVEEPSAHFAAAAKRLMPLAGVGLAVSAASALSLLVLARLSGM